MSQRPHIMVLDPALKRPELECLNDLVHASALPVTYHLPAMFGSASLRGEDLASVRGIVILGSASSVNERTAWQVELETWLMPLLTRGIPTLGLCYGHQMLAHMFGGRVEYVFADLRKHKGFRRVELEAVGPWQGGDAVGNLCVSHNEHVAAVPPTMRVIAKSGDIGVDGLAHRTLPIFSFQPHPEANDAFLANQGIDRPNDASCFDFGRGLIRDFLAFCAKG